MAQSRIGAATVVKNNVSAFRNGAVVQIGLGGSVFRNEAVATGKASSARLTFLDDTNLAIGPSSRVVLDEFVFSSNRSTQALTINLARGAFRFSTGKLDKRAYKIKTSTATIGVRGTILDIFSQAGRTLVTLVDNGRAFLCVTGSAICRTLSVRGQTFVIDTGGIQQANSQRTRFTFRKYCSGSLCARTKLARQEQQNNQRPPIGPVLPILAQQTGDAPIGCNAGNCTPTTTTPTTPTGPGPNVVVDGLAVGVGIFGPFNAGPVAIGLQLPNTLTTPLVTGTPITASIISDPEIVASNGPVTTTLNVPAGHQYTAWGEWNGDVTIDPGTAGLNNANVTRGFAIFGSLTPSSKIQQLSGTATYYGAIRGDFTPTGPAGFGPVQPGVIGGSTMITADFTNQKVSGTLNLTLNGSPWASPVFTMLPMNHNAVNTVGTIFEGSFDGPSTAGYGSLAGTFAGPAAEEIPGRFDYFKQTGAQQGGAAGIFTAKQGGGS